MEGKEMFLIGKRDWEEAGRQRRESRGNVKRGTIKRKLKDKLRDR